MWIHWMLHLIRLRDAMACRTTTIYCVHVTVIIIVIDSVIFSAFAISVLSFYEV